MATVRTRKRGKTWSYIFEAGQVNGKRKVVEKGGFATQKLAYNAGVEAYTDFRHGNIGITSEAITLKNFMTRWLEEVVTLNVKPTTLQRYFRDSQHHIYPALGDKKVQELTPAILDNWIRGLQKKGLAYRTISLTLSLLRYGLNYAVYPSQLISSNPANYIKIPKNAPRNIIKRTIITPEQFNALLEKYPFGTLMYIPLLLLYHTGMRLGEVLGLSWRDVDFEAKKITIARQITYIPKRGYCLTTPKTESSKRYIIVDDVLLNEMRRWRERQVANEEKMGDNYVYVYQLEGGQIEQRSKGMAGAGVRIELICVQKNGKIVLREYLSRLLKVEGLNAHSFRHTHATRLIEWGAPAKAVASRLGHTSTLITQNLYTHNTLKLQEELAMIFVKNLQTNG